MLYHLTLALKESFPSWASGLNVFRYVSFRALAALLSTLVLSFTFGSWFIKHSRQFFRAPAREHTPNTHQAKHNLPTMGGLFIIATVLTNCLLWCKLTQPGVWIFMGMLVGFGSIGFWDDWRKIRRKRGISARAKFCLQSLVALLTVLAMLATGFTSATLCLPFFKNVCLSLGLVYLPWAMLILIGTSNAVNLTDGLDGLAIGSLMSNFSVFALMCYLAGNRITAAYLHIPYCDTAELAIIGAILLGASIGFLWYNSYPAQIFMGDVGSLALGGSLAFLALSCKQELLLPIAGGLFVVEALSVIIQVMSFKLFKRRVFRMAPIHHHFELLGWQESKITTRFGIISLILSILALITLKIR